MRQLCYDIEESQAGMTVNGFARNVAGLSRGFLRSVKFKENGIRLNGIRVTTRAELRGGDRLIFTLEDDGAQRILPVPGEIRILYEDDDLTLVDKAPGMVVHPCHGHYRDTLLNHLAWYYERMNVRPVFCPVGRLDKDTSGLLLVARNKYAAQRMEQQRRTGELSRIYLALTESWFPAGQQSGIIDRPIAKSPDFFNKYEVSETGRPSRTAYRVLGQGYLEGIPFSLVRLKLMTGRTHQIRVHMADLGHPLLGDPIYGREGLLGFGRAALHSAEIGCVLLATGEKKLFQSELPADFQVVCKKGVLKNI